MTLLNFFNSNKISINGKNAYHDGDSITEGSNGDIISPNCWANLINSRFSTVKHNYGISGSKLLVQYLNSYRTNIQQFNPLTDAYRTWAFGVNDLSLNPDPVDFIGAYNTIINYAISKGWPLNRMFILNIYLIPSEPTLLTTINSQLATFCASKKTTLINVHDWMVANGGNSLLNGIHPNDNGHYQISKCVENTLIKQFK